MIAALIIALCVAFGVGSYAYSGKADNPVEQVAERIIETQMGLPKDTIDLTPGTK